MPSDQPLTVSRDTPLHVAIHMGCEDIAQEILYNCMVHNRALLKKTNALGDTVLHEAAAVGMKELAKKILDDRELGLLTMKNNLGETPLFRAAYCGQKEMFTFLADQVETSEVPYHLSRKDSLNVLHVTIRAEFFDLAFLIAERYPCLRRKKDNTGMIGLQILSTNPAAFKSGSKHGLLSRLIYNCIPSENYDDDAGGRHERGLISRAARRKIQKSTERLVPPSQNSHARGWPMISKIYNEKKKHESAFRLAQLLIEDDVSWEIRMSKQDSTGKISVAPDRADIPITISDDDNDDRERIKGGASQMQQLKFYEVNEDDEDDEEDSCCKTKKEGGSSTSTSGKTEGKETSPPHNPPTALLIATSRGIVEIVKEILRVYPQAVEHVSDKGQNILHVAIKYRQLEIFRLVGEMEFQMSRLVWRIDDYNYTILHHVGVMKYYTGSNKPGPALQLQEEWRWFKRVKLMIPPHYELHRSPYKDKTETAGELFHRTHKKLHKEAQDWMKRTSESCSAIAVLIATVAFAAAYTVPGGSNQKTGFPILLDEPFFLFFTIMDVLSLASSLTSVVMFLSILTSPFELRDFYHPLPQKLIMAFTFLFFSVFNTMMAFAVTIVLIIRLRNQWTTSIVYSVAFLPVCVFALLQLPLYRALVETTKWTVIAVIRALSPSYAGRSWLNI
ncbi:uncharacterized protein LOC21397296 [Morus notabilis]|nr:uncharacterized protein LOC21397296 [Morus notabilis]